MADFGLPSTFGEMRTETLLEARPPSPTKEASGSNVDVGFIGAAAGAVSAVAGEVGYLSMAFNVDPDKATHLQEAIKHFGQFGFLGGSALFLSGIYVSSRAHARN